MPSGPEGHRREQVFNAALANDAARQFGPRCPCCGHVMHQGRVRKRNPTAQNRRDRASIAHYGSISLGGNPAVWVWACRGCNNDQSNLTLRNWGRVLARNGDARADRVLALAAFVEQWCADRGTPLTLPRRALA